MESKENPQTSQETRSPVEIAAGGLFEFAIDREDVKWLLAMLPKDGSLKPAKVEYELQLLKIITVGWGITFYLGGHPKNDELAAAFWQMVLEFSKGLSETTALMVSQEIDYFETLKSRLDGYLVAMNDQPQATDPAQVAGPYFAKLCQQPNDPVANLIGAKMFDTTHKRVKGYFVGLKMI